MKMCWNCFVFIAQKLFALIHFLIFLVIMEFPWYYKISQNGDFQIIYIIKSDVFILLILFSD